MKVLLVVAVVALIHGSYATLLIKGPTEPVVEGQHVKLECMYSDSELNITQVHFEVYYQGIQRWSPVWEENWCFRTLGVHRTAEKLVLIIPYVGQYRKGPYRCVSDAENVTAPDNSSQELSFKVHYMSELSLSREGYTSHLGFEELQVRLGEDVVVKCSTSSSEEPSYQWKKNGGDWILPSSTLTLEKMNATDGGQYTCMAEHPFLKSLNKRRTITITVLPKTSYLKRLYEGGLWYEPSNSRLILITSAAAVSFLVLILFMIASLYRRAKQTKTSKGPIDDRSQKKPIYKSSVESLPSTYGDKQPLV
ncbi:hypothetical protein L3Q82_013402 [Scortum barcoo]|uniref:Uncharacterized protein n=1 Tax=Scortum barcoo TaxID=214431 RepID=A0ACB8W0H2_9TELE|nr:hypothetical protein L3Q82_013402 [Scortum barcoo]